MGDTNTATLDMLIRIREDIAGLRVTTGELEKAKKASDGFLGSLKAGFGIDIARRSMDFLSGAVRGLATDAMRMADSIKDGARNLEMSNEAYQVLGNVIKDAGGEMQLMQAAIANNNRSLVEARDVTSAAAASYRRLGLDAMALEQMPIERRFEAISKAIENATDKNRAFSDAGKILVSRNLPTLLGALRDLSEKGYDGLRDSMNAAGQIMSDATVDRLERAAKAIEKMKKAFTIGVGEAAAEALDFDPEAISDTLKAVSGAFKAVVGFGRGIGYAVGGYTYGFDNLDDLGRAQADEEFQRRNGANAVDPNRFQEQARLREQAELLAERTKKEFELSALLMERQTIEAQPTLEAIKRPQLIESLGKEAKLRGEILDLVKRTDPAESETESAKDLRIKKLEEEIKRLQAQRSGLQFDSIAERQPWTKRVGDDFADFRTRQRDETAGGIGFGAGAMAGAQEWVMSLGTQAEQVAGLMQSSLGATVSSIGQGIVDWTTGMGQGGDAARKLGLGLYTSLVQTVVNLGTQWLVTQALIKTGMLTTHGVGEGLRAQRIAATVAEGTTTTAALAPGAMAAGISSFGTAAIIGAAAVLAAMALVGKFDVGGYTSDGPRDKPAGIVHAGEWVAPAWMVRHPVYGAQIAAMENARDGSAPGYSLGGYVKSIFGSGGVPSWMLFPAVRKFFAKTNLASGSMWYGEKRGPQFVTDSSAAAVSARAAMAGLGSDAATAPDTVSSGGGGAGASLAQAAAAASSGSRSAFDAESFAERITIVNVQSEREAQAIALHGRSRGDVVRIVREEFGLPGNS